MSSGGENTFINIKVKGQDGNEVFVTIRNTAPLQVLLNCYCSRRSLYVNSIAFLFNGRLVRPEHTPHELGMVDGDEIAAVPITMEDPMVLVDLSSNIDLIVKAQGHLDKYFRMKRTTRLGKLMKTYSEAVSVDVNSIAFIFNGCLLQAEHTPNELQMKNGDEIHVVLNLQPPLHAGLAALLLN